MLLPSVPGAVVVAPSSVLSSMPVLPVAPTEPALVIVMEVLVVAPSLLSFDLPVMVAVMVACLPIFFTGHLIARWEGALFLAYYLAYTTYLILDATEHDAQAGFSTMMGAFVVPLTSITLIVLAWRHWHQPGEGDR